MSAPVTHAFADCLPTPDNHNCPPPTVNNPASSFNVDLNTSDPLQPYSAAYTLVPNGCTTTCALDAGTVQFYMGPAANDPLSALEGAAAMAPPSEVSYITRQE